MSFYKYYHPDSIDYIFTDKGVSARFSQPETLNDPFELNPEVTEDSFNEKFFVDEMQEIKGSTLTYREIDILKKVKINDYLENIKKYTSETLNHNFGIFSLSMNEKSSPMWSYYADEHRGFMIEFKSEDNKPSIGKAFNMKAVDYDSPRIKDLLYNQKSSKESKLELFEKLAFIKDPSWRHEEEYRLVSFLSNLEMNNTDNNGIGIHTYNIEPKYISRIILGVNSDEKLLRKILIWINKNAEYEIKLEKSTIPMASFTLDYRPVSIAFKKMYLTSQQGRTSDTPST